MSSAGVNANAGEDFSLPITPNLVRAYEIGEAKLMYGTSLATIAIHPTICDANAHRRTSR